MSESSNKAVFLSYASQDAEAAKRIADALRAAGVEVWFDVEGGLEHGDEWDAKIRRQIKECVLFIAVISANTQAREEGYFRLEWDLAVERARTIASGVAFILPVVVDDTKEPDALVPDRFRSVQWTRLPGGNVPPEVLQRFLKLWSHRAGVASHRAVEPGRARSGERGEGTASLVRVEPRHRLGWVAVAALLVLGGLASWWALHTRVAPAAASVAVKPVPAEEKSIAVLAFANLSDDKGNDSFGDSVSEELLNVLAQVPGLKVTARTSAFHFKGKDTPIPEIARQLGVAYVVEGSVRRAGDRVRITAQLIKAADGFHVWSDKFDREMKDIFAVQDEIAGLIARNLELKLGLGTRKPISINPEAYQMYLEARLAWGLRDLTQLDRAESLLKKVISLQPDFARAYAAMGDVFTSRSVESPVEADGKSFRELNQQALGWAERALALDPNLAEAYAAKGQAYDNLGQKAEEEAAYRKSVELDPNYATGHQWYGRSLTQSGYMDEALSELRLAAELDPLAPRILDNYAWGLMSAGKFSAALVQLDRALAIQPGSIQAQGFKAYALGQLGRTREALEISDAISRRGSYPSRLNKFRALLLLAAGRRPEVESLLEATPAGHHVDFERGFLLFVLGREREALPLLRPTGVGEWDLLLYNPCFDALRILPEFQRKLVEWGMTESHARAQAWRAKNPPEAPAKVTAAALPADDKSVAVLAFANLSDDKANEYFSDGISEELLNVLCKVPGLKVTARTSSFHFKGKDTAIKEIAQQLGVAYVVEGSVRKAGGQVRITAQLIKADDGFHVWSDTFTRELKDVFAVQDEIAGLIAQNLQLTLRTKTRARTVNPEAYELLLKGRAFLSRGTPAEYPQGIQYLKDSLAIDPESAATWSRLATGYVLAFAQTVPDWLPRDELIRLARQAADRAVALDPEQPFGHRAQCFIAYFADWDWARADASMQRVLALTPGDAESLGLAAALQLTAGHPARAREAANRAALLDPLNFPPAYQLIKALWQSGDYAELEKESKRMITIHPGSAYGPTYLSFSLVLRGRADEAVQAAEHVSVDAFRLTSLALAHFAGGKITEADAELLELKDRFGTTSAYQVAENYAFRKDLDQAFAWLEAAYRQRDSGLTLITNDPFVANLRGDARWSAFMRKMNLPDGGTK